MAAVDVVVMAAGKGTRMKSAVPKVLHRLGGRALLDHVVAAAAGLRPRRLVVVTGHGAEQVASAVQGFASGQGLACETVLQQPQLGTGHAIQQQVATRDVQARRQVQERHQALRRAAGAAATTTEGYAQLRRRQHQRRRG
jgi:bifunctional N-acetylglucosamine-1-phosphate-uridyltransferase/glucosamine-1-phosphate-acetyltransferase GlmU-like protein